MLRIGYDAKRLFHNFTGLGNYSRTLVEDMQHYFPENDYHLFSPDIPDSPRTAAFRQSNYFTLHTRQHRPAAFWRSYGIRRDLLAQGIQLYHGLSHEIPLSLKSPSIRTVVTIHDLVYKNHPQLFPFWDRQIYNWKFRYSCNHADRIVAISESTRQDIIKWYGIAPEKISVIYQTCHPQFKQPVAAATLQGLRQKYRLPNEYLLYVGALIERKNLLGLIQAMELLPNSLRIPLVVVGDGAKYKTKVMAYLAGKAIAKEILFLTDFQFPDLAALYREAVALCYPSFYEGFGIPLIEALFCETPVLTSRGSSLPEAAGPGASYVDPQDPESIANGLEKILDDDHYRQHLAQAGHQYIQQFHSEALARQMMDLYLELRS